MLGIEKFFLEKHPTAVCAIAFFEDSILISGSIDGRVNICDLESENQSRIFKSQNCQDRRVPIAKIVASDYGIATVVDIEGNCRLYDLIRLKKLCKLTCKQGSQPQTWRMVPDPCMIAVPEAVLAVS